MLPVRARFQRKYLCDALSNQHKANVKDKCHNIDFAATESVNKFLAFQNIYGKSIYWINNHQHPRSASIDFDDGANSVESKAAAATARASQSKARHTSPC